MKNTLAIIIIFGIFWMAVFAGISPIGRIRLDWDYPPNEITTDIVFRVYSSTNITIPITNWMVLTNVTTNEAHLTISPGRTFFYVTASNFWGESDPSNVVGLPPLPTNGTNLRIQRED